MRDHSGGEDKPAATRILFIPDAPNARTSERTPAFLQILRERYPVAALAAPWDSKIYGSRKPLWARATLYGVDRVVSFLRGIRLARRSGATLVFCENTHHALVGLGIARVLGIPCVWDSHGNGTDFFRSLGKGPWMTRMITVLERFLGTRVDGLITVSDADAAAYVHLGIPAEKVHVIPLCVRLEEIDRALATATGEDSVRDGEPILLFFGSFRYAPNREAIEFINARLAPELERRGLRCVIWIAGRDIPDLDFHPFVRPLGFVPDIYACIRAADVCIVPVRTGVGVLTKVIDAMAVGTPLVLSEFAARGIEGLQPGVHAVIASTDEEFLERVALAVSDPRSVKPMGPRARRLVEDRHDWRAHLSTLDSIVWQSGAAGRSDT